MLSFYFSSAIRVFGARRAKLYSSCSRAGISSSSHIFSSASVTLDKIRNLGIVAHIDAGKTTTSEYMLYLCGDIPTIGRVDNGDTVMDFLPQERERGITIGAAAISMPWRDHKINLIDTPGHVDFTVEVERSCRVLDGVVIIVDAVSGVQAQTRTVWKQAARQSLPAVVFVNKMDREGASFPRALSSIEDKLGVITLPLQLPCKSKDGHFNGYVDLLTMNKYEWMDVRSPEYAKHLAATQNSASRDLYPHAVQRLLETDDVWEDAVAARAAMLDALAGADEEFMEYFLEHEELVDVEDPAALALTAAAIRRLCLSRSMLPALCGASLRGRGVATLLDSVLSFLPSPIERPPARALKTGQESKDDARKRMSGGKKLGEEHKDITPDTNALCSLAFKVVHDKARGPLVYVRNYSGILRSKQTLWNATKKCKERLNQLLLVSADEFDQVEEIGAGEVACLVGLKSTMTGDTLVDFNGPLHSYVLDGLNVPKAVFSLVIEPEKSSQQTELEQALSILTMEDPSLVFEIEAETGQNVIRGIGELHLEIVIDKLQRQFGLSVLTGKTYVAYRETLKVEDGSVQRRLVYDRTIGTKRMYAALTIDIEPFGDASEPTVFIEPEASAQLQTADELDMLQQSIRNALRRGPRGYPVTGLAVKVVGIERDADTSVGALQACAAMSMEKLLSVPSRALLEPLMALEVEVPSRFVGDALGDLTVNRRAHIKDISSGVGEGVAADISTIVATVPLGTMLGYATSIRSLTQGEGNFSLEFQEYSGPMEENVVQEVLERRR